MRQAKGRNVAIKEARKQYPRKQTRITQKVRR